MADDVIEPFRPIVDIMVAGSGFSGDKLEPWMKQELFNISNHMTIIDNKRYKISAAIEQCVISLAKSITENKNQLLLPDLLRPEQYRYD